LHRMCSMLVHTTSSPPGLVVVYDGMLTVSASGWCIAVFLTRIESGVVCPSVVSVVYALRLVAWDE
jgi:hypothetical protein